MDLHKLKTYDDPTLDAQIEEICRYLARRIGSGTPVGTLDPRYVGDEYFDETNGVWYKANGTATTDWQTYAMITHQHTGNDVVYTDLTDGVQRKIITDEGIVNTEEL